MPKAVMKGRRSRQRMVCVKMIIQLPSGINGLMLIRVIEFIAIAVCCEWFLEGSSF